MVTVGRLASWNDLRGLQPAAAPAANLPLRQDLGALLGGRPLLHYCRATDAPSILASGLWPGSWCTITPLSAHIADVWLGTTRRKNYVIAFDAQAIGRFHGPGVAPPDGHDALRAGSAVEFYLPDGAPASAIIDHGPMEAP